MAVPKNRPSKSRTRRKHSINGKIKNVPNMVECKNCGDKHLPHRVCKKCGFYNGNVVVEV